MTLAPQPSYQQACGFQGDAIPPSPLVAKIARLASHMSFEISPHDIAELEMARDAIPPESSIAITWCPEDSDDQRVDVVNRIRRAGFVPLPHVAARALQDERALSMLLDRCHAADVREILLRDGKFEPEGEFETVLELLVRLRSDRFGLTGIGLWAYAGGRESMATELLDARLDAKLAVAQEAGLSPYVVTQCEFDAAPVLAWIERFRARGNTVPVRIGLAGLAPVRTLMRAAQAAGTGHSIRSLVSGGASIARMLEETCPDTMLQRLAQADVSERFGPVSIQLCMFGGLARSASWIDSVAHGKLRLHHNQSGFKVVV